MAKFEALQLESQGVAQEKILFVDVDVDPLALWESIYHRLDAVERLHNELTLVCSHKINNEPVSAVSSILLADIKAMFLHLNDSVKNGRDAVREVQGYRETIATLAYALAGQTAENAEGGADE